MRRGAVESGALAVLTDDAGAAAASRRACRRWSCPDVRDRGRAGRVAAVYGDPSGELDLLGVTGTSGKTTTTFFLRAGLQAAGRSTGADRHRRRR